MFRSLQAGSWIRVRVHLAIALTILIFTAVCLVGTMTAAEAGENEPRPDKSKYSLFNPTPSALMREMATDRPDMTESPYTVDAGHFQVEMDLVNYTWDHDRSMGDTRTTSVGVAPINLKVGLLNNVDLQWILETYNWVRVDDRIASTVEHHSGFGDMAVRTKWNLWGNDGGKTSFALMPHIKIPTAQDGLGNNALEGGLILPFAMELPAGWSVGMMSAFAALQNDDSGGYHPEFINTITFGHSIIGELEGYLEFASAVSTQEGARWVGTVDVGMAYGLSKDIRLDIGVNIGVTDSAEDVKPFLGLSMRF